MEDNLEEKGKDVLDLQKKSKVFWWNCKSLWLIFIHITEIMASVIPHKNMTTFAEIGRCINKSKKEFFI